MITPAPSPLPSQPGADPAGRRVSRYTALALLGLAFATTHAQAQSTSPPPTTTPTPIPSPPTEQPPTDVPPIIRPEPGLPPPTSAPPPSMSVKPVDTPQTRATINSATVRTLDDSRAVTRESATLGKRPLNNTGAVITEAGTGAAVGEGTRVLQVPGACTPKTNSLDCVADAGQAAQGANVSSRVRNSVIGEVGAGRGATEGSGNLKREGPCTPLPGQLSC